MITRASFIDIDNTDLISLHTNDQVAELIRRRLIRHDYIDINHYNIIVNKITMGDSPNFKGKRVWVGYTLERKSCWNSLEKTEERLKIGL